METRRAIEIAFLEDHQALIGGLGRIARVLAEGNLEAAVEAARKVDVEVGPHMRFEEEEYYPRLRQRLGDEFVDRLYHEHGEGQEGVRRLVSPGGTDLGAEEQGEIARMVETALEHARSCGTLLSHLDSFDESEQVRLLERLHALRERGVRWTEGCTKAATR